MEIIVMGVLTTLTLAIVLFSEYKIKGTKSVEDLDTQALKDEIKDLQESVDQIYEDYQDIGKMYFELQDKIDIITAMCSKNYSNQETKELTNEILKVLDVHAKAIPIKFGTAKNLERLIFRKFLER